MNNEVLVNPVPKYNLGQVIYFYRNGVIKSMGVKSILLTEGSVVYQRDLACVYERDCYGDIAALQGQLVVEAFQDYSHKCQNIHSLPVIEVK